MTAIDDALRQVVREEVRNAVQDALRQLLDSPPAANAAPVYLTTDEAAAVARVKPDTIRDWLKSGSLARHGTARHLLVRRDQLEAFLDAGHGRGDPTDAELEERAGELVRRRNLVG